MSRQLQAVIYSVRLRGRLGGIQPAAALHLLERTLAAQRLLAAGAAQELGMHQAQQRTIRRIHRDHRMQLQTALIAIIAQAGGVPRIKSGGRLWMARMGRPSASVAARSPQAGGREPPIGQPRSADRDENNPRARAEDRQTVPDYRPSCRLQRCVSARDLEITLRHKGRFAETCASRRARPGHDDVGAAARALPRHVDAAVEQAPRRAIEGAAARHPLAAGLLRGCLETAVGDLNPDNSMESVRSPIPGAFDVDPRDPGRA